MYILTIEERRSFDEWLVRAGNTYTGIVKQEFSETFPNHVVPRLDILRAGFELENLETKAL